MRSSLLLRVLVEGGFSQWGLGPHLGACLCLLAGQEGDDAECP